MNAKNIVIVVVLIAAAYFGYMHFMKPKTPASAKTKEAIPTAPELASAQSFTGEDSLQDMLKG